MNLPSCGMRADRSCDGGCDGPTGFADFWVSTVDEDGREIGGEMRQSFMCARHARRFIDLRGMDDQA